MDPVLTSTPTKNGMRTIVRSEGLKDLGATARDGLSELSSDERELREEVEEEERKMRADLKLHCPPTPVKVRTPRRLLPSSSSSGQPQILAEQIDTEILELRNFFEDHREEMMSLLHGGEDERNVSLPAFPHHHQQSGDRGRGVQQAMKKSQSMHFLPREVEDENSERDSTPPPLPNPYSLPYQYGGVDWTRSHDDVLGSHGSHRGLRNSQPLESQSHGKTTKLRKQESFEHESESDAVGPDRTIFLRRREFEKRRLRNRERRKKAEVASLEFDHSNSSANNNNNNNISSFFPVHTNTDQMAHVVPRLNLESVCSDVTLATGHSLDVSLASQAEDIFGLRQRQEEESLTRRRVDKQVSNSTNSHINSSSTNSIHGRLSSRRQGKQKSKVENQPI